MYNTPLYNQQVYNTNTLFVGGGIPDQIEFNGFSLQSDFVITSDLTEDSTPQRELDVRKIPRNDGSVVLTDFYRTKTITLRGIMKKPTACTMDEFLDEVKRNLSPQGGNLDIKDACGEQRRYIATLTNGVNMFSERRGYHITFVPFTIEFTCFEPFANAIPYTLQNVFDNSDIDFDFELINEGTYKMKPHIIFIFTAASGITDLTFTNSTNGKAIQITTAINALDVIEIDSVNQLVKKNSAIIDYDGVFPDFEVGQNFYNVLLSGASATYTMTIKYKDTFL